MAGTQFDRPPAGQGGSTLIGLVAGVLVGLLVVVGIVAAFVLGRGSAEPPAEAPPTLAASGKANATAPTEAPAPPPPPPAPAPATSEPAAGPGNVLDEPAGLFCRDLEARGYSYAAAVDYWYDNGQPDQMDADLNGVPCETVFPASTVRSFWGSTDLTISTSHPSGLLCADVAGRGADYPEAVAYWFAEGAPDRMDADLNGIPCETVYSSSEVVDYWGAPDQ